MDGYTSTLEEEDTTAGHNTSVIVNNVTYPLAYRYADYGGATSSLLLPVKKGDTYKTTGGCEYVTMYFLPQHNDI